MEFLGRENLCVCHVLMSYVFVVWEGQLFFFFFIVLV
jgi:hypothetical protein